MEILVVIGILMLLMGIGVVGYRHLDRQASVNATRTTLSNANALVAELAAAGAADRLQAPGGTGTNAPPFAPTATLSYGDVTLSGGSRSNALLNSEETLRILANIPKNKTAIGQLPAKTVVPVTSPFDNKTWPAMVDAWNNPIVFIPSGGLTGVTTAGGSNLTIKSPDGKPFWASAGPDGSFSGGDDNVYSYEK